MTLAVLSLVLAFASTSSTSASWTPAFGLSQPRRVTEGPVYPSVAGRLFDGLGQFVGASDFRGMGLDIYGRVQTKFGCDLGTPGIALRMTWRHGPGPSDTIASADEVYHEWARVSSMQSHKLEGGASKAFRESAHLYVDGASLKAYLTGLVASQEAVLRQRIKSWDSIPAPAQMARLRTSYAEGPYAAWPKLDAAIEAGEWQTAANESKPGDYDRQNSSYRASYDAVKELYLMCDDWPGGELPDALPGPTSGVPADA